MGGLQTRSPGSWLLITWLPACCCCWPVWHPQNSSWISTQWDSAAWGRGLSTIITLN